MNQNKKAVLFIIVGIALYGLIFAAVSSASFARAGGTANVFSHSSDVQIEADSVGDVTTVTGNRNSIPYQPENDQHKRGESIMLWAWVVVLDVIVWFMLKALGMEIVGAREKGV